MLPGRQVFLVDTHVNVDPTAEELCRDHGDGRRGDARFGIQPKAALLSHSNFGTSDQPQRVKMRDAWRCCASRRPGWRSTARCTATWRSTPARRR
jgi:malate dehydrogenase (oxaloacetate-decarboxylating)(NADP+)